MANIVRIQILLLFFLSFSPDKAFAQIRPAKSYGELFRQVQEEQIFSDQKRFVDCSPLMHPDSILVAYQDQKDQPHFLLRDFVGQYFDTLQRDTAEMFRHLNLLWEELTRQPEPQNRHSSLIALPHPYIMPGGRFKEIYYWDSYFTMLGLQVQGETERIENMVRNFAWLIREYGFIPNGNRTYYLSRSQPPFFAMMVNLLAESKNDPTVLIEYCDVLEKEYQFWMSEDKTVRVGDGSILNRYYDKLTTPRPESYLHDQNVFLNSHRDSSIFRDLRSAAESGWDFSSRWFTDGRSMEKIETTRILPVDLNCLLFNLEQTISSAYLLMKNTKKAEDYSKKAEERKERILTLFRDEDKGFFFDYNVEKQGLIFHYTLAGLFPLFFNLATPEQAEQVAIIIEKQFLKPGGLVTSLQKNAGQQWDYPNGWAPLQWIGYVSLKNYGYDDLAKELAQRWTDLNMKVYFETGKMMEKYDVVNTNLPGGGGEYPTQDGFGWTNGVFLRMMKELE